MLFWNRPYLSYINMFYVETLLSCVNIKHFQVNNLHSLLTIYVGYQMHVSYLWIVSNRKCTFSRCTRSASCRPSNIWRRRHSWTTRYGNFIRCSCIPCGGSVIIASTESSDSINTATFKLYIKEINYKYCSIWLILIRRVISCWHRNMSRLLVLLPW